jgi:hypothetical protein
VRSLVVVCLVAKLGHADVIQDRELEATRLEAAHDWASLRRASELRAALGQRAKWIATAQRAIRRHGKIETEGAAKLMFELAGAFEGDALADHMRAYLRMFGDEGDRALLAHALLGSHAWTSACAAPAIDGLCVRIAKAHPASCHPKRERWAAVARDQSLARPALAELGEVVRRFELKPSPDPTVRAAYADAKRILVDAELEVVIARSFPKLTFTTQDASRRSSKRLDDWMKAQAASRVTEQYQAVLAIKDPHASVASALRIAQHDRILASHLVTSALPHRLATGEFAREKRDAYCEYVTQIVEPLDYRAIDALSACAAKARELEAYGTWWASCTRELVRSKPDEFPPLVERLPSIGWVDVALERKSQ